MQISESAERAPYRGDLLPSLTSLVEQADEKTQISPAEVHRKPKLIHKQDGRNYFRLTELPADTEIHCSTVDCDNLARLLLDSRDAEVLAYCAACAHVEFAMWMVGV